MKILKEHFDDLGASLGPFLYDNAHPDQWILLDRNCLLPYTGDSKAMHLDDRLHCLEKTEARSPINLAALLSTRTVGRAHSFSLSPSTKLAIGNTSPSKFRVGHKHSML